MRWNVTPEEYHADQTAISSTGLRELIRSPKTFQWRREGKIADKDTPSLVMGSLLDCILLTPDRTNDLFHIQDKPTGEGMKKARAEIKAGLGGRAWIEKDDFRKAKAMVESVLANGAARILIEGSVERQCAVRWQDPITDLWLKVLFDVIGVDGFCDVKTAAQPGPWGFAKAVRDHDYHVQAALYDEAFTKLLEYEGEQRWIVVGNEPPHETHVYEINEDWIGAGRSELDRGRAQLVERRASGNWEHIGHGTVEPLPCPAYIAKKADANQSGMEHAA